MVSDVPLPNLAHGFVCWLHRLSEKKAEQAGLMMELRDARGYLCIKELPLN